MNENERLVAHVKRLEEALESLVHEHNQRRRAGRFRIRVAGVIVGTAVAVVSLLGADATVPKTIESQKFVLRGRDGLVRASLSLDANDAPRLAFFDAKGKFAAGFGLPGGEPSLALLDAAGKSRITMALSGATGEPSVWLRDRAGRGRVSLGFDEREAPLITLRDEHEQMQLAMTVHQGGVPQLVLFHAKDSKTAVSLTRDPEGGAVLGFKDNNQDDKHSIGITENGLPFQVLHSGGRPRLHLSILKDGSPFLNFYNPQGKRRIGIEDRAGTAGITLFDDAEKPRTRWQLLKGVAPHQSFFDSKSSDPRLTHGLDAEGYPIIALTDKDEKRRLVLGILPLVENPYLHMLDAGGKPLLMLPKPQLVPAKP